MESPPSPGDKPKSNALFSKKDEPEPIKRNVRRDGTRPGTEQLRFLPDHAPGLDSPHKHRDNFDINLYATKKSAAQGLLDLALLMANASQLKHIIMTDGDHRFYTAMIALLSASIVLQIIVAIGLLFLARIRIYDYDTMQQKLQDKLDDMQERGLAGDPMNETTRRQQMIIEEDRLQRKLRRADFLNNLIVSGIFILTAINVFISSFGLNESPRKEQHVFRDSRTVNKTA